MSEPITIIDAGNYPRLSNSRITILNLYPFFRDGQGHETILRWMPTLTREALVVAEKYICEHRQEVEEAYERDRTLTAARIAAQRAKGGLFAEDDRPAAERLVSLHQKLKRLQAERNGAHVPA